MNLFVCVFKIVLSHSCVRVCHFLGMFCSSAFLHFCLMYINIIFKNLTILHLDCLCTNVLSKPFHLQSPYMLLLCMFLCVCVCVFFVLLVAMHKYV